MLVFNLKLNIIAKSFLIVFFNNQFLYFQNFEII